MLYNKQCASVTGLKGYTLLDVKLFDGEKPNHETFAVKGKSSFRRVQSLKEDLTEININYQRMNETLNRSPTSVPI